MTHEMAVMGRKGDHKQIWDPSSPDEVETALATSGVWPAWMTANVSGTASALPIDWPPHRRQEQRVSTEEAEAIVRKLIQARLENEAKEAKLREEEAAAVKRAKALLFRHLSRDHLKEYKRHKHLTTVGSDGVRYRIKEGWAGNVEELSPDGAVLARYCIHPHELMPLEDNVLAQKLWLEADAERFRATANRTPVGMGA